MSQVTIHRTLQLAELKRFDTEVYVVSVVDDDTEYGRVTHAIFREAEEALEYAYTCNLQLLPREALLIEGFQYGVDFDPTTVKVSRPDLSIVDIVVTGNDSP